MSEILEHLPAWREHLQAVAAAEAERDRLQPVADAVEAEHAARVSEHREAVAAALEAGEVPPPTPPEMPLDAHRALAQARDAVTNVKRRGSDVLAAAVDDVETLVRDRATDRDREARGLADRLEALAAEQRDDSRVLAHARESADPGHRPTWAERTHTPGDVHDYVEGIVRGVEWAEPVTLAALGIVAPETVKDAEAAWHASRSRGPLQGPEYREVRAADRRVLAFQQGGRDLRL